jgi:hypothetical protein
MCIRHAPWRRPTATRIWDPTADIVAKARSCRVVLDLLRHDRKGEEAAQYTQKTVVTSLPDSESRPQKILNKDTIDCLITGDVTVFEIAIGAPRPLSPHHHY